MVEAVRPQAPEVAAAFVLHVDAGAPGPGRTYLDASIECFSGNDHVVVDVRSQADLPHFFAGFLYGVFHSSNFIGVRCGGVRIGCLFLVEVRVFDGECVSF